jgi:predicted AAA+ superfamily ATPase
MLPFSFKEYIQALSKAAGAPPDLGRVYKRYITESSFPFALELSGNTQNIKDYLGGIYSTIVLKDIINRANIGDSMMLESIINFMFYNIGNLTSTTNIANTMKSAGRAIAVHTVENYIAALLNSYIFYRVGRYDIKGKQYLKTGDKYYAADLGLRHWLLGEKAGAWGSVLENIVYLQLRRMGYAISVGKIGDKEIDFVAQEPSGATEYYQVALSVRDDATRERELAPLNAVKDHNAKYLLTLDDDPLTSYNGIRQIYALDWLLGQSPRV